MNQDTDMTDCETEGIRETRREPSNRREDGNSMSQDNRHGQNQNDRLGYASNVDSLQGMPNGNSPGVVNALRVQHITSSDDCVGIEADGEHLKACGTHVGNRQTTGITIVETTLVLTRDNTHKRPRTNESMIHTDANIGHEMKMF